MERLSRVAMGGLPLARNTVRNYLAQVTSRGGLQRQLALPRAELWAKVSESCPELVDRAACTDLAAQLRALHVEIVAGLKESTAMTVWQRLRDAGRLRDVVHLIAAAPGPAPPPWNGRV